MGLRGRRTVSSVDVRHIAGDADRTRSSRQGLGTVDCGNVLWALQNPRIFEILGTGFYHPVLALIPEADRASKSPLARDRPHVFWRSNFTGSGRRRWASTCADPALKQPATAT